MDFINYIINEICVRKYIYVNGLQSSLLSSVITSNFISNFQYVHVMKGYIYDFKAPTLMSFSEVVPRSEKDSLKDGEILVRVHACALNPVDYKKPDLIPLASMFLGGTVVAQDYSGVVVFSKSSAFKEGDEVFGTNSGGCLGEYLATSAEKAVKKPSVLSHIEAASLVTVCQTTLQAFKGGGHSLTLKPGQKVLVLGASGGCGLAGVQIARNIVGKEGIVVGVCSAGSNALVSSLNVTDTLLDYTAGVGPLLEALKPFAPFDIIYDTVSSFDPADTLPGGVSYVEVLRPLLKDEGCHVAINGSICQWVWAFAGWQSSKYHLLMQNPNGEDMKKIAQLVEDAGLKAVMDSVHPFTKEGCEAAYARLKSRRSKGKVVIQLS